MELIHARRSLGHRIRQLRKEQNLSVRKFALMVNLSKDYIIDIEYGRKSPSLDTLLKIAWGLDITPAVLLEGIEISNGDEDQFQDEGDFETSRSGKSIRYHSASL